MRWITYLRLIPRLIKSLPLNREEFIKFTAKLKDVFINPSQSSIEFITAIVKKQNFIIQRVISIVLLFLAMILGADIGINYERKNSNPDLFEPKILTSPLERPEDRAQAENEEIVVPLIDPLPPEYKKQLQEKKQNFKKPSYLGGRVIIKHKTIVKNKIQTEIFEPFTLNSSGVNGY